MGRSETEYLEGIGETAYLLRGQVHTGVDMLNEAKILLEGEVVLPDWNERASEVYYDGAMERTGPDYRNDLLMMRLNEYLQDVPPGASVCEFGTGEAPAYVSRMWDHVGRVISIDPVPSRVQQAIAMERMPKKTELISQRKPPYSLIGMNELDATFSISATHVFTPDSLSVILEDLYQRTAPGGRFVSLCETDVSTRFFQGMNSALSEALHADLLQHRKITQPNSLTGIVEYATNVDQELQRQKVSVYNLDGAMGRVQLPYTQLNLSPTYFDSEVLKDFPYLIDELAESFRRMDDAPVELQSVESLSRYLFEETGEGVMQIIEPIRRLGMATNAAHYATPYDSDIRFLNNMVAYTAEQVMQDLHMLYLQRMAREAGFSRVRHGRRVMALAGVPRLEPVYHEGMTLPAKGPGMAILVYRECQAIK